MRRRFLLTALFLTALPLALLAFCQGGPSYYSAKYSPADAPAVPTALPLHIIPEHQTESHTCGLHSLSAIYTAYGLDPETLRLRFRVGVDKPFTNFLPDTTGAIHPDMLRVLAQDGFHTEVLRPAGDGAQDRLRAHLDEGHPALALVRVNGLHWIVLASRRGEDVVVCDSLAPEPRVEPLSSLVDERVLSLLLVRPSAR